MDKNTKTTLHNIFLKSPPKRSLADQLQNTDSVTKTQLISLPVSFVLHLPSTMASITILSISLLLLLLILPSTSFTTATSSSSSLQKLLHNQGLPGGVFPDNVNSFDLDPTTGLLEVQLDGPCLAKFENRVFFDSVVRANLSFGGLIGLEGLAQEELFLWFPVKGIFVRDPDSGVILMDLGLAHKQLPVSLFEDPPSCQEPQGVG
ncbi:hypothetical protein LINGRAPRIM_LOCUS502 [Linum grandiflorum]